MTAPRLILGDCVEAMRELPDTSVDAVVTDPPYGLEFMGKEWDAPWKHGFSATGYSDGEKRPPRPNYGSTRNPMCRTCRKHQRGSDRCACEAPDFDERPADSNRLFQAWTEAWAREALRVLKPGGHALVFGGTRTFHRMASGLEDAGFEIRDTIAWMFGSGFPKSHDVARAIDKAQGAEGGWRRADHFTGRGGPRKPSETGGARVGQANHRSDDNPEGERFLYEPESDDARAWHGWGTALKPAFEPIVVARKPLSGTVAANVLEHGTGALNIDASRIGTGGGTRLAEPTETGETLYEGNVNSGAYGESVPGLGRWPANVVLGHHPDCALVGTREVASDGHYPAKRGEGGYSGGFSGQDGLQERHTRGETVEDWDCHPACAVRMLDEQSGVTKSSGGATSGSNAFGQDSGWNKHNNRPTHIHRLDDIGGASRFFYCAKVSRAERNAGLDGFEPGPLNWSSGDTNPGSFQADGTDRTSRNRHPTVKPVALMRWLIRLVTPPGGTVLDPFLGSGSTGCAAAIDGYAFVGIEREQEYMDIAEARIRFWAEHGERALDVVRARERADAARATAAEAGQLDLLAEFA